MFLIDNAGIIPTDYNRASDKDEILIKSSGQGIPSNIIQNNIILENQVLPPNTKLHINSLFLNRTLIVVEKAPEVRTLLFEKRHLDYNLQIEMLKSAGVISEEEGNELLLEFDEMGEVLRFNLSLPYIEFIMMFNTASGYLDRTYLAFRKQELSSIVDPIFAPPLPNISESLTYCHSLGFSDEATMYDMANDVVGSFYTRLFNSDYNSTVHNYINSGNMIGYIVYWHYITKKDNYAILAENFSTASYKSIYELYIQSESCGKFTVSRLKNMSNTYKDLQADSMVINKINFIIGDEIEINDEKFYIDKFIHRQEEKFVSCVNIKTNIEKVFKFDDFIANKILSQGEGQVSEITWNDKTINVNDFILISDNENNIKCSGIVSNIFPGVYNKIIIGGKYVYLTDKHIITVCKTDQDIENHFRLVKGNEYLLTLRNSYATIYFKYENLNGSYVSGLTENSSSDKKISFDVCDILSIINITMDKVDHSLRFGQYILNKDYSMITKNGVLIKNNLALNDFHNLLRSEWTDVIHQSLSQFLSDDNKTLKWENIGGSQTEFNVGDKILIENNDNIIEIRTIASFIITNKKLRVTFSESTETFSIITFDTYNPHIFLIDPYIMLKYYENMDDVNVGDAAVVKNTSIAGFYKKDVHEIKAFTKFMDVKLVLLSNGKTVFFESLIENFDIYKKNVTPSDIKEAKKWKSVFEKEFSSIILNAHTKIRNYEIVSMGLIHVEFGNYRKQYISTQKSVNNGLYNLMNRTNMTRSSYSSTYKRYTIPFPIIKFPEDVQKKHYDELQIKFGANIGYM